MDCCSPYSDYRHPAGGGGVGGGGGSGGNFYGCNQMGNVRHPSQMMPMYRGGAGMQPTPVYNDYMRYGGGGYPNAQYNMSNSPGHGYFRENYEYPQNGGPGYYGYHPYDGYRYSYHHKEPYSSDGIYNSNGYAYPFPSREHSYHNSHHSPLHHPPPLPPPTPHPPSVSSHSNAKDVYQPQSAINDIETIGNQQHPGSPYAEYPVTAFPAGPNGLSPTISNATGFPFSHKESRPRKMLRDKEKSISKSPASIGRKNSLESSISPMTNDSLDRCSTPFYGPSHPSPPTENYNNFPFGMRMGSNGYIGSPPNWNHLPPQPSHASNSMWMQNGNSSSPYSSQRSSFRKNNLPLDEQINQMPPPNGYSNGSQGNKDDLKNSNIISDQELRPTKRAKKKLKQQTDTLSGPALAEIIENTKLQMNKNVTPLPGFQQAFGSTEIGRFSEVFFNLPESPAEQILESEADTLSPQPWEMGDSLEGPHYNLQVGSSIHPLYTDNYCNMDSPSSNYFREIRCNEY